MSKILKSVRKARAWDFGDYNKYSLQRKRKKKKTPKEFGLCVSDHCRTRRK